MADFTDEDVEAVAEAWVGDSWHCLTDEFRMLFCFQTRRALEAYHARLAATGRQVITIKRVERTPFGYEED